MKPRLAKQLTERPSPAIAAAAFASRANAVTPGGVNSPVRAWNGVGGHPIPIASAAGATITDVTGATYVDLVGSWGAAIVGHAHPHVVDAVTRAAERGLSFGAVTEAEVELAEEIRLRYPPAQRVRLVSTGTEATMTAIRLARAATGRDLIITFAGCYHGHSDALLVTGGSGLATLGIPASAGVTKGAAADTVVLPYGHVRALEEFFFHSGDDIAAVIAEAAPANMGVVRPPAGFNDAIARLTHAAGSVFIADEVLTGFRAGPAGYWGIERDEALATGAEPWIPDLVTFGKVIGGGLPVAAVGGRAEIMELLAPVGKVYQAGTLSGNPVAVAAGRATLELLDPDAYARLSSLADGLERRVTAVLTQAGRVHAVGRAGTLLSVFLGLDSPPVTFEQASGQDIGAYAEVFHAWLRGGVYAPPSAFEALFLSLEHTEEHLETVAEALSTWANA